MSIENKYKAIIWDWNGTLLNDVEYSLRCINTLLMRRNMPQISMSVYKELFTFPVKLYYERIGFDFNLEPWEKVAMEFMREYWSGMHTVPVFEDAIAVLSHFKSLNIKQYIVSAMEHKKLNGMVEERGMFSYFKFILGISDHYANSKTHLAKQILDETGYRPKDVLWVGDTYHDYEVANAMGVDVVLLSCGHQSEKVLSKAGVDVFSALNHIIKAKEPKLKLNPGSL